MTLLGRELGGSLIVRHPRQFFLLAAGSSIRSTTPDLQLVDALRSKFTYEQMALE